MGLGFSSAGAAAFDGVQELLAKRLQEKLQQEAQTAEIDRSQALTSQGERRLVFEEPFFQARGDAYRADANEANQRAGMIPELLSSLNAGQQGGAPFTGDPTPGETPDFAGRSSVTETLPPDLENTQPTNARQRALFEALGYDANAVLGPGTIPFSTQMGRQGADPVAQGKLADQRDQTFGRGVTRQRTEFQNQPSAFKPVQVDDERSVPGRVFEWLGGTAAGAPTDQSVILDQAAGGQPTARLELIRQQLENEGYTDVTEEELRTLLPRFPEFFPELSPESAR